VPRGPVVVARVVLVGGRSGGSVKVGVLAAGRTRRTCAWPGRAR
jgi:hypothetical protein